MLCEKCGEEISDCSLFCNHCGAPVEKEQPKEAEFTIVLYEVGNNKIKVVEATQKWFNCSLQEAFDKVESLPVILTVEKDQDTANGIVREWQRLGAEVRIADKDVVDVLNPSKSKNKAKKHSKKTSKAKTKSVIKMISSCLFTIATVLFLLLPIVFNRVSIDSQIVEKPYSLLNLVIIYITNIMSGEFELSFSLYRMYPIIIIAFVTVMWVKMIISTVKAFIGDLKDLTKSKPLNYGNKIGFLNMVELIGYTLALFFILSFDGLVLFNAIIIAISAIIATILETISFKI